jgi:hypothetical protein
MEVLMKIMLIFITLFITLSAASTVCAQEVPKLRMNRGELAGTALERLKVKDANTRLDDKARHELAKLFIQAYVAAVRQGSQDSLLEPSVPIYQLFKTNFPEIGQREGDGGVFVGNITRFLNTLPEYRQDVETELRRGPMTTCKKDR